jgi:uncharacterized repeat protein (TIGR03803 family)
MLVIRRLSLLTLASVSLTLIAPSITPVLAAPRSFARGAGHGHAGSGGFAVLYRFQGGQDGAVPYSSALVAPDGSIFGTTTGGGEQSSCTGCGVVYRLTPRGSGYAESIVHAFKGGMDGSYPVAGLTLDASGALYGTTMRGGDRVCSCGTVFKLTPTRAGFTERTLHRFRGHQDGEAP